MISWRKWRMQFAFGLMSAEEKRFHERFLIVDLARYRRRPDGIFAGELDRTSPHRRGIVPSQSGRQLLEDVHDRDSTGRDPGVASLFLETDPGISQHFSKRRTGRPQFPDASAQSDVDCICRDRAAIMGVDESDRQKPRKPVVD